MTDIDEVDSGSSGSLPQTSSIRGSLINTPKDFPEINPSGKNELNDTLSSNVSAFENVHLWQGLMMREGDEGLDISVSSVCATPRNMNALGLDPDMSQSFAENGLSRMSSLNSSKIFSPMKEGSKPQWGKGSDIGVEGASQMTPRLNAKNLL